jgi:hypothetical protein
VIARVGSGSITRREFDFWQLKTANQVLKKPVGEFAPRDRRQALEAAIVDELIFQAAVAEGMLSDSYVRSRIIQEYRSSRTTARINPELYSDVEVLAYYNSHQEEFTEPAAVKVEGLQFLGNTPVEEVERRLQAARTDPEGVKEWRRHPTWVSKGETLYMFPDGALDPVVEMKVGEVTAIKDRTGHFFILRVAERRDRRVIPFGEARGKIKFAMIGHEDKNRKAELASSLMKPNDGLNDEERLFRAAVDSGTARNAGIHLYVVNAYLARRKMDRDQLAAELRGRFQVEILLSE